MSTAFCSTAASTILGSSESAGTRPQGCDLSKKPSPNEEAGVPSGAYVRIIFWM